ncbi:AMP-binding protein, partial [Acidovorax sp. SUPP2825]|uniref:AMP-binding protein n=1 Tax=Acidovorax sp. SUPP2825 TaxID=2920879 RepID=UPI0024E0903B
QAVAQALRQTHVALTGLLEHEHASLSLAQRCSGLEAGVPLFTTLLNYRHGASASEDSGQSWEGMEILGTRERTNYPFGLYVNDRDGGFELVAHIAQQVGAQRVAEYVRQTLEGLVQALARRPSMAAVEVAVLDDEEDASLRQKGISLRAGLDAQPLHRLVERQAINQPGAIALRCEDQTLTYGELNARANGVAHRLMALGVVPETRVGIAMQRSVEMVVGLLAI